MTLTGETQSKRSKTQAFSLNTVTHTHTHTHTYTEYGRLIGLLTLFINEIKLIMP